MAAYAEIMDVNDLLLLLGLLTTVVGGLISVLWAAVAKVQTQCSEDRITTAEQRYVTGSELDGRLDRALKPIGRRLDELAELVRGLT